MARTHPVEDLLSAVAYTGQEPRHAEVVALDLPSDARHLLTQAVAQTAALRADGERLAARRAAEEGTAWVLGALPEPMRDPGYLDPVEVGPGPGPAELAGRVSR